MKIQRRKNRYAPIVRWLDQRLGAVLAALLFTGEAIGALCGGGMNDGAATISGDLMQYCGYSISRMFFAAAGPVTVLFAVMFFAGTALGGTVWIPLAVLFRGLGIGASLGMCFRGGSFREIADGIFLLLPYCAGTSGLLLAQGKESIRMATDLNRMVIDRGYSPDFMRFVVRSICIFAGLCACALLYAAAVCMRY